MFKRSNVSNLALYNEELKVAFLEQYVEGTIRNYRRYFLKASKMEEALEKDLCKFSLEELGQFLKYMNTTTIKSLQTILCAITNYIDFAIQHGYLESKINWAKTFGASDMVHYVNKIAIESKFITREELYLLMDYCENTIDGCIFGLLFEGIKGETGLEDLVNLKRTDIQIDVELDLATIKLANGRVIEISDSTIVYYLSDALEQEFYKKTNSLGIEKQYKFSDTEYLFRVAGQESSGAIKEQNLYNRLKKMRMQIGNQVIQTAFLNPTNIWVSGMIDYAKNMIREYARNNDGENKELNTNDYKIINRRFGYNEDLYHTTKTRIKDFV